MSLSRATGKPPIKPDSAVTVSRKIVMVYSKKNTKRFGVCMGVQKKTNRHVPGAEIPIRAQRCDAREHASSGLDKTVSEAGCFRH